MRRMNQGIGNYSQIDNSNGSNSYFSADTNNQGFNNQINGSNQTNGNNQMNSNPYQIQNPSNIVTPNQGYNNLNQANQLRNWKKRNYAFISLFLCKIKYNKAYNKQICSFWLILVLNIYK